MDNPSHEALSGNASNTSLIFQVSELFVRPDEFKIDEYGRRMPPEHPGAYSCASSTKLIQWRDGSVGEVPWKAVMLYPGDSTQAWPGFFGQDECYHYLERYKVGAVFVCPPLHEIVATTKDPMFEDAEFNIMQINQPYRSQTTLSGVSQLITVDSERPPGGGGSHYPAGKNPTWIPALVTPAYDKDAVTIEGVESKGLGGELTILIALMAFHAGKSKSGNANKINRVFLGKAGKHRGLWQNYRWHGSTKPKGYPVGGDYSPRGFAVSIYLDPCNPQGSTHASLNKLEWERILVYDQ